MRQSLDRLSIDRDVDQNRRTRDVHVLEAVMYELEMPLPLSGSQIDRNHALAEQARARTLGAEVIVRRELDRQVREIELFVRRNLAPYAGVAGVRPRIVQPGVVAEFAGTRDRVEDPEAP